mgnify:CR=1 FL=1
MKCAEQDLLLYAVTDRHWLNGRSLRDVVEESLRGGVTMLQLREKSLAEPAFLAEARELQALCRNYHVPFIVNDNVDIALAMDADGVHVGQSDMEALDVRRKLGPDKIIGVSAQTVEQALLAEKHGADYLGVGAVFPTGSKDDADDVSYDTLQAICWRIGRLANADEKPPTSILNTLLGKTEAESEDSPVQYFDSPEEFEAAMRAAEGGEPDGKRH